MRLSKGYRRKKYQPIYLERSNTKKIVLEP
jgi:hypothetical protein